MIFCRYILFGGCSIYFLIIPLQENHEIETNFIN